MEEEQKKKLGENVLRSSDLSYRKRRGGAYRSVGWCVLSDEKSNKLESLGVRVYKGIEARKHAILLRLQF